MLKPWLASTLHDPADGLWFYRHFHPSEGRVGEMGSTATTEPPIMTIMQAWENQGGNQSCRAPSCACMGLLSEPSDPVPQPAYQ